MPKFLNGKKSYIIGIGQVLVGTLELLGFDVAPGVDASNALALITTGLSVMALRDGITTENAK